LKHGRWQQPVDAFDDRVVAQSPDERLLALDEALEPLPRE
jgi:hypothetical protein